MTTHDTFASYIEHCRKTLEHHERAQRFLTNRGIAEPFVIESYFLGYSDGSVEGFAKENEQVLKELERVGLLHNGTDIFRGCIIIPIYDENKEPINVVGYSISPQKQKRLISLQPHGIFNAPFLSKSAELVLTNNPTHALALIAAGIPNTTFVFGDEKKYGQFCRDHGIRTVLFTYDGSAKLFYELTASGISAHRAVLDIDQILKEAPSSDQLKELIKDAMSEEAQQVSEDAIQQIEHGFLFRLTLLTYRVIGNFNEFTMSLKVNIRATRDQTVFVDSIDLYRNRDRQNFIFNLMDQFDIRDQLQLEGDLATILAVIEKHKEQREKDSQKKKPELTDNERSVSMDFLRSKNLCERINEDYNSIGYLRERKNKLLLYLVMTSRLMDTPLHSLIISRSSAGKSRLAEITEELCPPEEAVSVSDLSPQALFYYGQDDLKNKFIVIGEKHGSEAADYPLRELISRKSITKAIPMKDPASGQIKTVTITVNGPIALVETSTSAEVNPENLNRCFIIGIDESEEQTGEIHKFQRRSYTLDGFLTHHERIEIVNRHIFAQRLLQKVHVFNPFAELLTFPTSKLRSRRDNEKFLRLITAICFLHQYQRKVKTYKLDSGQEFEYIECTIDDYRIAYDLLSDGVLENTLDDLPRPARALLNLIKEYLDKRAAKEDVLAERITFERKEIREYTSWSFAQVRNNFRILKDYEYIKLIKAQSGIAHQYKLNGGYTGLDLLHTILSPDELKEKLRQKRIVPTSSDADEAHEPAPVYGLRILKKPEHTEHRMNIHVFSL